MEYTPVQKLARVLKVLVIVLFVLNIVCVYLLPAMFDYGSYSGALGELSDCVQGFRSEWERHPWGAVRILILSPLAFPKTGAPTEALLIFLMCCGVCSAVMLWQAKRVIDTVLWGEPFSPKNAHSMKRAAICCFAISLAALVRLIWSMCYYRSAAPLVSYNTLFIPVFAVAGLVCMVMSALFRQAAEIKAENDLTI